MNEIAELLKSLGQKIAAHIASGATDADKAAKRTEVLDAIRTGHHELLWQPIANVGFAAGKASRDAEVAALTTRAEAAEAEKTRLTTENATLADKNRDVKSVQDEAARKIQEAETKAQNAIRESAAKVEKAVKDRDVAAYEAKLVALGLHPDNAKAQGILFRERAKYDKDGVLSVMQEGSDNIPYTVHGDELLTVIAGEVTKKLPATMFTSKVDKGADTRGDSVERPGGGTDGDLYENIRKEERARAESKQPVDVRAAYQGGNRFTSAAAAK